MLNIVTVGFNHDFLEPLYNSIPKEEDVIWYVHTHEDNTQPEFLMNKNITWIRSNESTDFSNFDRRINILFKEVLNTDPSGHFQIVDEDTLYNPNAYKLYKENQDVNGLIIGNQVYCNGTLRLRNCVPSGGYIDTGSCISSVSLLNYVEWDNKKTMTPDAKFWLRCYNFAKQVKFIDEPLSFYNAQLNQLDEQDIYRK